jgi:hypothetical protein
LNGWHEEALSVYDMAASQEQAELVPALMKKRAAFLREMYKTHSYSEIQSDPMIRRLMTFGSSPEWKLEKANSS